MPSNCGCVQYGDAGVGEFELKNRELTLKKSGQCNIRIFGEVFGKIIANLLLPF